MLKIIFKILDHQDLDSKSNIENNNRNIILKTIVKIVTIAGNSCKLIFFIKKKLLKKTLTDKKMSYIRLKTLIIILLLYKLVDLSGLELLKL